MSPADNEEHGEPPEDLVVDLEPSEYWRVVDIMALAFRNDPGFQAVARGSGRGRDDRIRAMVESTLSVHVASGSPVRGIFREGKLLAVTLIERPNTPLRVVPSISSTWRLAWEANPLVAARSARAFLRVMGKRPRQPHHYLSMIAVDPITQGFGMGRTLLDDLHATCAAHPASAGVALDTSNPDNVSFYERFGYQIVASLRISGTDVWCMWRPTSADDRESDQLPQTP